MHSPESDLAATHWSITGRHDGDFFGLPATGKHAAVEGMDSYRLADGEDHRRLDTGRGLGLMEQLGATLP